jgi:hypothetical protein
MRQEVTEVQEFRTPWQMTQRAVATSTRTGDSWPFEKMKKAEEHKMEQERALLFGERKVAYTNGAARYATRGLQTFVASANKYNVGGTMAEADFDDWVRSIFRAGSGGTVSQQKILLANDRLLATISRYSKVKQQTKVGDSKYGVKITDYVTPHGDLKMVYHKLLDEVYSTSGYGLVYDPKNVKLRYFKGDQFDGHTKLHENIQANDVTARTDEYRTTVGLEVMHANTHGEVSNVLG